jgi:ABC-type glutathione transport system ATPase component
MVNPENNNAPLIGLVGPCGSGKTTIAAGLRKAGLNMKAICQEHSYVPAMWQRITRPDVLVFLDASHAETKRRKDIDWTMDEYQEQHRRLSHARIHADIYLYTDGSTHLETMRDLLMILSERNLIPQNKYLDLIPGDLDE